MLQNLGRTVIFFFLLLGASVAFAEVRSEIRFVHSLQFDGDRLFGTYSISGGCAEHWSDVDIEIEKIPRSGYTSFRAIVRLQDVTAEGDDCEAMIQGKFDVRLKELILKKAAEEGIRGNVIDVELPRILVSL